MTSKNKSYVNSSQMWWGPKFETQGLYFEIREEQMKENKYLFKSGHLLLDSVYKPPLYYKTEKKQNISTFSHEPRKKFKVHFFLLETKSKAKLSPRQTMTMCE